MSEYASVDSFAAELGVERHTIFRAIEAGKIPVLRIGRQFRIPRAEALEALRCTK